VLHVILFYFFLPKIGFGGPKLLQLQNLGGSFVLRGPKSQLREN